MWPRPSGKTPANASGKGFLPPNPVASTLALSGWNCRKISPLWPICGVKEAFPPARPPSPWAFPTRPSSAGPKNGNLPNKQAFRKSGKSHFFEFCRGLAECLRSHTALPRWRRAAAPILRSRAGPVVRRKAKKVWPSGHRTKESMAVRPPDQRGAPPLRSAKTAAQVGGFCRLMKGRANAPSRLIRFSAV